MRSESLTDCGRAYPSAECGAVSDQAGERTEGPGYKTTRMEAFGDGVFAIAITLLVLEIGIPSGSEDDFVDRGAGPMAVISGLPCEMRQRLRSPCTATPESCLVAPGDDAKTAPRQSPPPSRQ